MKNKLVTAIIKPVYMGESCFKFFTNSLVKGTQQKMCPYLMMSTNWCSLYNKDTGIGAGDFKTAGRLPICQRHFPA